MVKYSYISLQKDLHGGSQRPRSALQFMNQCVALMVLHIFISSYKLNKVICKLVHCCHQRFKGSRLGGNWIFFSWTVMRMWRRTGVWILKYTCTYIEYLLFDSHHHPEHKLSIIRALQHLVENIPTKTEEKERELQTCGYPNRAFVKSAKKSGKKYHNRKYRRKERDAKVFEEGSPDISVHFCRTSKSTSAGHLQDISVHFCRTSKSTSAGHLSPLLQNICRTSQSTSAGNLSPLLQGHPPGQ